MKEVTLFGVLAFVLLGILAGMVACFGDAGGANASDGISATGRSTNPDTDSEEGRRSSATATVPGGDLRVSGPFAHRNLEIYLLHGMEQTKPEREILTLEEALQQGKAVVHETNTVNQLTVENLSPDTDVYVQAGDIVQGGKQDRVLAVDLMLSPQSGQVPINSYCVEQGRWGARNDPVPQLWDLVAQSADVGAQQLGTGGYGATPASRVTRFDISSNCLSSLDLKRTVKIAEAPELAQNEVWSKVAAQQAQLTDNLGVDVRSSVSDSSLQLTLNGKAVEAATGEYTKALSKVIDGKDDVLGFAAVVNGKIVSADVYGSTALFQKLWNKLLTASAVEAVAEQKEGKTSDPIGAEKVKAFLADVRPDQSKIKDVTGRVQLVRCEGKSNWFFETRDRDNGTAWLHRNYLPK